MLDATVPLRPVTPREIAIPPVEKPRRLGDYRLLREIGRGGMGIVYEAEQESLHRRVALKIMAGPSRWDAQARERFEREARSAAQLHHTNIVPIFDVGVAGDEYFYAMQFIDGIGLDALIARLAGRGEPLSVAAELASADHPEHFRALARLALQVAGGLAHAHIRGVIHRDIKPANLLLDTAGVVWITDFGLAKQADDNLTRPGDLFGTIRYMAPERFAGGGDARADIYALGATLYELVTRRAAYPDVTEPAHVARLAHDPPRPSALEPRVPRDLETIILKAMDKDPERRYATAQDFADDLRRFLDDEPIRARPIGPFGRAARWAKRRPVLASLTATVLALTATIVGGAIAAAVTFRDLAENEVQLRRDADAATELSRQRAKAAVDANAASQEIAVLMLGILDETDPLALSGRVFGGHGNARSVALRPELVLQRTLAKLDASPEIGPKVRAKLYDKIGSIYVSLGQVERGGPLLEKALALRRAEHGDDSLEAAETWHNLGVLSLTQRSFESGVQAYSRALTIRERELGAEHPLVTVTVMHLGIAKSFGNDASEAPGLLRRARIGLRKHPGPESREYALAVTALAAVLLHEGQVDEALPMLPEALQLLQKHEGDSGVGRAVGLFLQGRLSRGIGLNAQATRQYRDAVQLVAKSLGEEHFLVMLGRGELAAHLHGTVRDLNGAEAEYIALQRLCVKNFGPQSAQAAMMKMYLARVLRDQKRFGEAEPLLLEASDALRKRKHASLARCLHIYGEVLFKQGKTAESISPLQEAVRERKKGGDLVWYSHAVFDLAVCLERLGKPADAAQELRDACLHLAQQQTLPPRVHWLRACRCAHHSRLLKELDRDREADEAAAMAIDALRSALKTNGATAREIAMAAELNGLRHLPEFKQLQIDANR